MAHAHDSVFLNVCVLNVDIKLCLCCALFSHNKLTELLLHVLRSVR